MASLKDIKKSILEMPEEEVLSLHERIRESRYVRKKPVKRSRPVISKRELSALTLEEIEELERTIRDRRQNHED